MAQLFIDSFSGYATADLATRWAGGTAHVGIQGAVLPPNSQAGAQTLYNFGLPNAGTAFARSNTFAAAARQIVACRFYRVPGGSGGAGGNVMVQCKNQGFGISNPCCAIRVDDTGTTLTDGLLNNGNPNTLAMGPVIPAGEWHHLEMDTVFGTASNATINVYLDGNPTPFIHVTGVSLQYATSDAYTLFGVGASTNPPVNSSLGQAFAGYITDHYAFDGTGSAPENAALAVQTISGQKLGAPRVAFTVPAGPGRISNWTANGAATIWQSTNQIPQDGDTTYASSSTVNNAYMCTLGTLPSMQTFISAQVSTYSRMDDAGPRSYQSGFGNGAAETYSGTDQFLGGTYNYIQDQFPLNPVTGVQWVPGDLAGLQFGLKLTT